MEKFKTREDLIKHIQRILLINDYEVLSIFQTTKHMKENLKTNQEWLKEQGYPKKFKDLVGKFKIKKEE